MFTEFGFYSWRDSSEIRREDGVEEAEAHREASPDKIDE